MLNQVFRSGMLEELLQQAHDDKGKIRRLRPDQGDIFVPFVLSLGEESLPRKSGRWARKEVLRG
jgi:hypothetical protein